MKMGAERGELPLWAVLCVAAGVLVLGLQGSKGAVEAAGDLSLASADSPGDADGSVLTRRSLIQRSGAAAAHLGIHPGGMAALMSELVMPQIIDSARTQLIDAEGDTSEPTEGVSAADSAAPYGPRSQRVGSHPGAEGEAAPKALRSARPTSGLLLEEGGFLRGIRHGEWTIRRAGGTLAARGSYDQGLRDGTWRSYDEAGWLVSEVDYDGGSRDGDWVLYGQNGVVLGEGQNANHAPVGRWTRYYSNGRIKERGVYVDGLRHGVWEFYDDLGAPTSQAGEYLAGIKIN